MEAYGYDLSQLTLGNKMQSQLSRVLRLLPDKTRGRLDYRLGHHTHFYPWGSAFNGQTVRRELCRRVLVTMKPDLIVETGTYRGTTTEFLAQFGVPVVSIESSDRYFEFSRLRLSKFDNVSLIKGSSDEVLEDMGKSGQLDIDVFAYLDAHWYDYLPLREEISTIARCAKSFIALVDDFEVPGDSGYKFDDYGPNGSCTLAYVEDILGPGVRVFFPTVSSSAETGVRRGYCLIAAGESNIAMLETFSELN